jgi:hypothetical protein
VASIPDNTGPTYVCSFCGATNADGRRFVISTQQPGTAICDECLTHLERGVRQHADRRATYPPEISESYEYPLPGLPTPFYHRLLRVIPVLQSERHETFELTVVDLEVYSESFLMTCWLQALPKVPDGTIIQPLAWVTLSLSDDLGTQYTGGQSVSTTSVGPGYYHGRVECQFTPTLKPEARKLQVHVPEIRWEFHQSHEAGQSNPPLWGETESPWQFLIELPAHGE